MPVYPLSVNVPLFQRRVTRLHKPKTVIFLTHRAVRSLELELGVSDFSVYTVSQHKADKPNLIYLQSNKHSPLLHWKSVKIVCLLSFIKLQFSYYKINLLKDISSVISGPQTCCSQTRHPRHWESHTSARLILKPSPALLWESWPPKNSPEVSPNPHDSVLSCPLSREKQGRCRNTKKTQGPTDFAKLLPLDHQEATFPFSPVIITHHPTRIKHKNTLSSLGFRAFPPDVPMSHKS